MGTEEILQIEEMLTIGSESQEGSQSCHFLVSTSDLENNPVHYFFRFGTNY